MEKPTPKIAGTMERNSMVVVFAYGLGQGIGARCASRQTFDSQLQGHGALV
jgi:hypothetical protein